MHHLCLEVYVRISGKNEVRVQLAMPCASGKQALT